MDNLDQYPWETPVEYHKRLVRQWDQRIVALEEQAKALRVVIESSAGGPVTCRVYGHGVLIFDGVDRSVLLKKEA